ncbi:MAG TPA: aminoglycoside phosphotransferase family protein [Halococcus sp.]|nr:aminoglycoside phosphotransferase family protein [Halococcus sp.]
MTTQAAFTLSPDTAVAYLRDRGLLADGSADATSLGGGVSNRVVRVRTDERTLVLKQPLANLAVEDDWPADVVRVHNEATAARAYATVIDAAGLNDVRVPDVLFEDEREHVVGFECIPDATMWKRELLGGHVELEIARSLGRFLGTAHRHMSGDDDLREQFADKTPFEQLRVTPYHRTTAERHPEVADEIRLEIERVLGVDRVLVHGDYSPKNVLVADGVLWLLDFEVAHWGDPAFDTAFMLNHLFIKSIHIEARQSACIDAALAFWQAYCTASGWEIERATIRELAVLLLARVDGKSPVEYIDAETGEILRIVAIRALCEDVTTLRGFTDLIWEVTA